MRSAECGVRSAGCGVRGAECGVRSAVRGAGCGVRCGVRECGVRGAGVRECRSAEVRECRVPSAACGVRVRGASGYMRWGGPRRRRLLRRPVVVATVSSDNVHSWSNSNGVMNLRSRAIIKFVCVSSRLARAILTKFANSRFPYRPNPSAMLRAAEPAASRASSQNLRSRHAGERARIASNPCLSFIESFHASISVKRCHPMQKLQANSRPDTPCLLAALSTLELGTPALPHSALGTARRTPHAARRTPHAALRTPHPAPAPRTPHSAPHSALRTPHSALSATVSRNKGDRSRRGEGLPKQIGPCEAVHVATDREAEVVQDRRGEIEN